MAEKVLQIDLITVIQRNIIQQLSNHRTFSASYFQKIEIKEFYSQQIQPYIFALHR